MPTVKDAARVTTRDGAVWRTCTGCALLAPLPPQVTRCPSCTSKPADSHGPDESGWERVYAYSALVGGIRAWASMPDAITDEQRLAKIRQALAEFDAERGRSR